MLSQPLWRKLAHRGEDGERYGKVEARSFLPQSGRCEVHGDPLVEGPLERRGHDAAADAVLRLLAGSVGEADDREPRDAGLKMCLDFHFPRLETDESVSDRTCEHFVDGRREGATEG